MSSPVRKKNSRTVSPRRGWPVVATGSHPQAGDPGFLSWRKRLGLPEESEDFSDRDVFDVAEFLIDTHGRADRPRHEVAAAQRAAASAGAAPVQAPAAREAAKPLPGAASSPAAFRVPAPVAVSASAVAASSSFLSVAQAACAVMPNASVAPAEPVSGDAA